MYLCMPPPPSPCRIDRCSNTYRFQRRRWVFPEGEAVSIFFFQSLVSRRCGVQTAPARLQPQKFRALTKVTEESQSVGNSKEMRMIRKSDLCVGQSDFDVFMSFLWHPNQKTATRKCQHLLDNLILGLYPSYPLPSQYMSESTWQYCFEPEDPLEGPKFPSYQTLPHHIHWFAWEDQRTSYWAFTFLWFWPSSTRLLIS